MSAINLKINQLEDLPDEDLIECYREGQIQAIEVLVQRYKIFVRKRIKSNYFIGADKEDLIQEGMIGLFKAICDYNPVKDASFKSFATLCITRQISTAFKMATRQKHIPLNTSISLNIPVSTEEDDSITLMDTIKGNDTITPEDFLIYKEDLANLQKHIKESLSSLEWRVLNLHTEGRNYHEIAKDLGKSIKSIDNALQRIKRKLGQYA
ncbi:MAG: RNA polymerase sporulation sigma factor SigH [Cellulosilyticaceae bacterium]